jgi:hypothetical protein
LTAAPVTSPAIVSDSSEQRRLQRVRLFEPLPGRIGGQRVFIVDISRQGLRVAHQESLGAHGDRHRIEFEWDGHEVSLDGTLSNTYVRRATTASSARNVYHSGFTIVGATTAAMEIVREMIVWHVERALDERKANARGIPPIAARSFQTGSGREYVRHVFTAGMWREIHTTEPKQPPNGFTISATERGPEVKMLRTAWEAGDADARLVIQKMAELSISRAEGIPTRRYTP